MKRAYILSSLIFLLTSILFGCNGRNQNSVNVPEGNIEKKEKEPSEIFYMDKKYPGEGGVYDQWKQSDSLYRNATMEELVSMASKPKDPIMGLVSFRALLWKNPHEAVNLLISEIDDTTSVCVMSGDCSWDDMISDVRISMAQLNRRYSKITKEDSMRIDSAILFSDNALLYDYPYHLFKRLPAKPEYEARLRQLYKRDIYALVALARFHKDEDKQDVMNLLSQVNNKNTWETNDTICATLLAVAAWPDKSFMPSVQKICENKLFSQESNGCREEAFSALIAYDDQWSYRMIEKALSKQDYDMSYRFEQAYENNPLPRFKPLYQKYKPKQNIIY